jgi:hypothetical protein
MTYMFSYTDRSMLDVGDEIVYFNFKWKKKTDSAYI